jgi:hypothetical protein
LANWVSSRFDFENSHWQDVASEWVPEMNMNVGSCISALKKSWAALKIKRREGFADPVYELEARINRLQEALGIEVSDFGHQT